MSDKEQPEKKKLILLGMIPGDLPRETQMEMFKVLKKRAQEAMEQYREEKQSPDLDKE